MNKKRHPDYMNLKRKINSTKSMTQLERLRQVTIRFNKSVMKTKYKDDGHDLVLLFLNKETEFNDNN